MSQVLEPGGGAASGRAASSSQRAAPGAGRSAGAPDSRSSLRPAGQVEPDGGPPLEWRFNPWRERPLGSVLASLITLGGVALLATLGVEPLGCAALGGALALSLGPLLLPSVCRVDDDGVSHRRLLGWERRRWSDIRRAVRVRGGLLLSPFEHPRRLDSFRALMLPMPRDDRVALTARLAPRLSRHGLEGR